PKFRYEHKILDQKYKLELNVKPAAKKPILNIEHIDEVCLLNIEFNKPLNETSCKFLMEYYDSLHNYENVTHLKPKEELQKMISRVL
ncbi:hypothetical protein N9M75_02020, partial [Schleiferiaceae bacterium]|nr:hypothetical protein [Schleiferiaceae bacterium]